MTVLLEVACGLAAGVLAGLFGVGGGILLVPAMVLVLSLCQHDAQATSLAAMIPAILVGGSRQQRYGNVRRKAAGVIGACSLVGVAAGTVCATALPDAVLRVLFSAMLVMVAGRLVASARERRRPETPAVSALGSSQ